MIGTATRSPSALAPSAAPAPNVVDKETEGRAAAHPFAELLRQNRLADAAAAAAPAPAPAKAAAPRDNDRPPESASDPDRAESTSATGPAPATRDAAHAKSRLDGASHAPARTAVSLRRTTDTASHDKPTASTKDEALPAGTSATATATTATAAAALPAAPARADLACRVDAGAGDAASGAALQAGSQAASLAGSADAGACDARSVDAIASRGEMSGNAVAASARPNLPAAETPTGRAVTRSPEAAAGDAARPSFAEALAESKPGAHADRASSVDDRGPVGAAPAAAQAEPARAPAPAAVAAETVPVRVDSPDFAAAFGLQIGALARDGVQRAELHLNPTEMGPVSIQITLDGTQARVDFGADIAATRQAIENGLPELASALRDAGFTLAGGGVSQHSGSNGGATSDRGADRGGSRRGAPDIVARLDAAAQRATRRASAGGVDLYA